MRTAAAASLLSVTILKGVQIVGPQSPALAIMIPVLTSMIDRDYEISFLGREFLTIDLLEL